MSDPDRYDELAKVVVPFKPSTGQVRLAEERGIVRKHLPTIIAAARPEIIAEWIAESGTSEERKK